MNVKNDLIQKELNTFSPLKFKELKLSNRFINNLFRKYSIQSLDTYWYDSEPEIPSELLNDAEEGEEYAIESILGLLKDYEPRRLEYLNWIDSYCPGKQGLDQNEIERMARYRLNEIRSSPVSCLERLFYNKTKNQIILYYFGRDYFQRDELLIFRRKQKRGGHKRCGKQNP